MSSQFNKNQTINQGTKEGNVMISHPGHLLCVLLQLPGDLQPDRGVHGGDLLQPVQQREEPLRQRQFHLRVRQLLARARWEPGQLMAQVKSNHDAKTQL